MTRYTTVQCECGCTFKIKITMTETPGFSGGEVQFVKCPKCKKIHFTHFQAEVVSDSEDTSSEEQ